MKKLLVLLALVIGFLAFTPSSAQAWWGHHHHDSGGGGHYHHHHWYWPWGRDR